MEQIRPAIFPFYAAQFHHNMTASLSSAERFRFPGPHPQFYGFQAAAMFPAMLPHPLAAHNNHQHQQQQQHQPHNLHHPSHHPGLSQHLNPSVTAATVAAAAAAAAATIQGRLPTTQQPALNPPTATASPLQPPPPHPHHQPHHPHQMPLLPATGGPGLMMGVPGATLHLAPRPGFLLGLPPALTFSQEELDTVLYGYSKALGAGAGVDGQFQGHAISGLILPSAALAARSSAVAASPLAAFTAAAASASFSACRRSAEESGRGVGCHRSSSSTLSLKSASPAPLLSMSSSFSPAGDKSLELPHGESGDHADPLTNFGIDKILSGHQTTSPAASVCSASSKASGTWKLDPSSLELPEGLAIVQTSLAGVLHYGVFCTRTVISRGARFGPYKGRVVHTSEVKTHDDNSNMWEIFQDGKLSHFIDGRGSTGNWMSHVKCARYAQEQNLIAIQAEGAIWYEACKDIPQGTELLVWYGDCYLQFMGVPVSLKEMADGGTQEEADNSEGFHCERCGKVFAYKYYRDKHLKYTRCVDQGDRKFPCTLCSRSFEKRDRLRIHILHVHEKHRPHKCLVCSKSFSQSSSLNKHMRVHSGERPYKCVYCNKAFTASSILRTHIRQHSGEKPFKCKHCGKAFASHAAHDSHVRRTHTKERSCVCNVCGKSFAQSFELKFHMNSHLGK